MRRVPILHRVPLCENVETEGCKICKYYSPKVQVLNSKNYLQYDDLITDIQELEVSGTLVRLIIDREIPQEVLWAASYSAYNTFQLNIDMQNISNSMPWMDKVMVSSNRCGMYCLMVLYPIVPGVVTTLDVVRLIDRYSALGNFQINLKFFKTIGKVINSDSYLNFNSKVVSTKNLFKIDNRWECNELFKQAFIDIVNSFAIPHKVMVIDCDTICSSCIGG